MRLYICTAEEVKEVLDALPNLENVYDSGNMILVGEDPVIYYDTFADNDFRKSLIRSREYLEALL